MTGSGSALFGIFRNAETRAAAAAKFPPGTAFPVRFVPRKQFRKMWMRALGSAAPACCLANG